MQRERIQRRPTMRSGRLAVLAAGSLTACSLLDPPPPLASPPDLTFRHVHLEQYKLGVLSALSTSEGLQYTRDTGHMESQRLVVSPVSGSVAGGTLTAGSGIGSTHTGLATLAQAVRWVSATGEKVETGTCDVDLVNQTTTGHVPVRMFGPGYELTAPSWDARYGTGSILHLHGGARAIFESDDDKPAAAGSDATP